MQCVILAGGPGTWMRPVTETCPTTLLPVHGRPFADYQLHWLAAQGVTEVVYSAGQQADQIRRYWSGQRCPVPSVRYINEDEQLPGTAGALRLARERGVLEERFIVTYADSFLPVEFGPVWHAFQSTPLPALMTILRNEGRWDRSNVIYQLGRVIRYDKNADPGMQYVDYRLSCLRRDLFDESTPSDLSLLLHQLSLSGRLAGYEVHQRFYEIGSPGGLRDFETYLELSRGAHDTAPLLT